MKCFTMTASTGYVIACVMRGINNSDGSETKKDNYYKSYDDNWCCCLYPHRYNPPLLLYREYDLRVFSFNGKILVAGVCIVAVCCACDLYLIIGASHLILWNLPTVGTRSFASY
jgi:hypothetical protein